MNKAYEYLNEWVRGGHWPYVSHAGTWSLSLNDARSMEIDVVGFRDDMARLLEAAERGGIDGKN